MKRYGWPIFLLFIIAVELWNYLDLREETMSNAVLACFAFSAGVFFTCGCYPTKDIWGRALCLALAMMSGSSVVFHLDVAGRWIYLVSAMIVLGLFGYGLFSRRRIDDTAVPSLK